MAEENKIPQAAMAAPACQDLLTLVRAMIRHAHIRVPRVKFLRRVSRLVLDATNCDRLALTRMRSGVLRYHSEMCLRDGEEPDFLNQVFSAEEMENTWEKMPDAAELGDLRRRLMFDEEELGGRFWTNDTTSLRLPPGSLAIVRFEIEEGNYGLMEIRNGRPDFFNEDTVLFLECLAQYIGVAIADRRARASLQRRLKELTYLYEIAGLEQTTNRDLDQALVAVVDLIPSLFADPEHTRARILWDDVAIPAEYDEKFSPDYRASLVIEGVERGVVELVCARPEARLEAGMTKGDEQQLLETVAGKLAGLLARRESREERTRLEGQLRHADRLATIGQLAAGVAHELNEPLTNILGYAELIEEEENISARGERDLGKIISATMHGREIVQKLLIFARQMPTRRHNINLNEIVEDSLFLLDSRCAREGIELVRQLLPDLPPIFADPGQMRQVLVNLVVNAIQAISGGGRICIETRTDDDSIILSIEDTGCGMTEEVRSQVFLPFYTTKDVGQGTGLGLPVVHGIVTAHDGSIKVSSKSGHGTRFVVSLPRAQS
ncbi:MAG: ATP-binding protein [bacterium]